MRLPYSDFDDGSADNGAGSRSDTLTPRHGGDADIADTPSDGSGGGSTAAPADEGPVLTPIAGEQGAAVTMAAAPVFSATEDNGLFVNAGAASFTGFGSAADPNPLPGGTAGGNEPLFDSPGTRTALQNASAAPSAGAPTPAVSDVPGAATGTTSDGGGSGLPAAGLSGGSGGSMPVPAFDAPGTGDTLLPSTNVNGATGTPTAGTPGVLPLVGDLGTIYQPSTPMQSDSGGSSGSSPSSAPAGNSSGFVINVSYDQSVSSLPAGFVAAINDVVSYYESIFTAPITVNIDVGYGEIDGQQLQTDALGESETFLASYGYSSVVNGLAAIDPTAAASLPSGMPVSGTMWVGTAEAKALGLELEQPSTDIDGFAGFSDVFPFTYDPNNRAVPSEYDFIGVVEHEFTEVMGRIDLFGDSIGGTTGYSLLDMFHYTAPGHHTYTGLTANYFSANGGTTNLDNFNDSPQGDLGDWASSAGADSYLAFTPTDEEDTVSQSDITEMNALGYSISGQSGSSTPSPPPPPPPPPPSSSPGLVGTAVMIMGRSSDGTYEIYDIGHNASLLATSLGQISTQWQIAGVGGFNGTDTSDMLMRNSSSGALAIYDVGGNAMTGNVTIGAVGLAWSVTGFGDFSGRAGETDMLMRNVSTGQFEVYDIAGNQITSAAPMGQVGLEWQVLGFGDFSGNAGETDMLMRNTNTGTVELYDIAGNQITKASSIGTIAAQWQVSGFGDFSGNANETDMLMRNVSTGAFEIYDISAGQLMSPISIGQVGLEWTVAGFGDLSGTAGETDMLMRNSNTGAFELYDIARNTITAALGMGAVGLEWQVGGIVNNAASNSQDAASFNNAASQLIQAAASLPPSGGALNISSTPDQIAAQAIVPTLLTNSQTPAA